MVKSNDMKNLILILAICCAWLRPMAQVAQGAPRETLDYHYTMPSYVPMFPDTIAVIMLVGDTSVIHHGFYLAGSYTNHPFNMPSNSCFWLRGYIIRDKWRGFTMLLDEQKKPIKPGLMVWMWQAI